MECVLRSPSGNTKVNLKRPPSQRVFALPGIAHSQVLRSRPPWGVRAGFATKPKGWSRRHCFLCNQKRSAESRSKAQILRKVPKKKKSLPFLLEAVLAERHDFRYRSIKSGDMEWARDGKVEEGKVARRSDWGNQAQGWGRDKAEGRFQRSQSRQLERWQSIASGPAIA